MPFVLPAAPAPAPAMTPANLQSPALAPSVSVTPSQHVPGIRPGTHAPAAVLQLQSAAPGPAAAPEPCLASNPAQRQQSSSAAPAALAQEAQGSSQTASAAPTASHLQQPAATAVAAEMAPELAPTVSHQPAGGTQSTPLQYIPRPAVGPRSSMSHIGANLPQTSFAEAPAGYPACPPCTCPSAQAPAQEPSVAALLVPPSTALLNSVSTARAPQPMKGASLYAGRPCLISRNRHSTRKGARSTLLHISCAYEPASIPLTTDWLMKETRLQLRPFLTDNLSVVR